MAGPKKLPTSRLGRIARLGGLSSRVSGSYLGQRISGLFQDEATRKQAMHTLHIENAERVVDTMSTLKGAAMKVGQYASIAAEGLDLPEDVARIFRKLTHQAEPIPFEIIREDIEASLEAPLSELFSRFDSQPLGTASLGQAHAAWLPDGRSVVVKVLHRGIDKAVDADLAALRGMLAAGGMVRRRRELDGVFNEIRARLHEELDYYQEAANLEFFAAAFASDPDIRVPATQPSHCTDRVLTMDRLLGEPLEVFADHASREAKQRAGVALARSFHVMLYELRALHADPHAGNYLVTPDGVVGLLDFGCVRRFDPWFVGRYSKLALSMIEGQRNVSLEHLVQLGVIDEGAPRKARDLVWRLCDAIAQPFRVDEFEAGGPDDHLIEQLKGMGHEFAGERAVHPVPEFVFLDRALIGNYLMLRKLHCRMDYGAFARPYLARAIAEVEAP